MWLLSENGYYAVNSYGLVLAIEAESYGYYVCAKSLHAEYGSGAVVLRRFDTEQEAKEWVLDVIAKDTENRLIR